MKNDSSRFGHIIQLFTVLLTAILISLFFAVLVLVGKIQGTARVVNYAGLVRGKTQLIVKLEISGTPEDALLGDMASYIEGLRFGSSELNLVRLDDADFQAKMAALSSEFDDLRNELILVRQRGYAETAIIAKSEHFFQTCDEATHLAEVYSQKRATALDFLEKVILADIVGLLFLFGYQIFKALRYAAMNRILQCKVYLDEATGLPNKNKCEELLDAPDPPDGNTALCVFDLNNLRTVNNNLGHDKGDEYIRSFAEQLRLAVPSQHFVGRDGGDEFIAILYGVDWDGAQDVLRSIRAQAAEYSRQHPEMPLSYAAGCAIASDFEGSTLRELFRHADKNMYVDKNRANREEAEARKLQDQQLLHWVNAHGYQFSNCLYCDALLDQYRVLRTSSGFFLADNGSYSGAVEQIVDEYAASAARKTMREALQLSTLSAALSAEHPKQELELDFETDGVARRGRLTLLFCDADLHGRLHHFLVGFEYFRDKSTAFDERQPLTQYYEQMKHSLLENDNYVEAHIDANDALFTVDLTHGQLEQIFYRTTALRQFDLQMTLPCSYDDYCAQRRHFVTPETLENYRIVDTASKLLERFHSGFKYVTVEYREQTSCGEPIWLQKTVLMAQDTVFDAASGREMPVIHGIILFRDTSIFHAQEQAENQRLQEAFEEADSASRAKTAFMNRMSHDIRTPINGILGMLDILRSNMVGVLMGDKDMVYRLRIDPKPAHFFGKAVIVISRIDHNGRIAFAVEEDVRHPFAHAGSIPVDPAGIQRLEDLLAPVHPAHCVSLKFRFLFRHARTSFLRCDAEPALFIFVALDLTKSCFFQIFFQCSIRIDGHPIDNLCPSVVFCRFAVRFVTDEKDSAGLQHPIDLSEILCKLRPEIDRFKGGHHIKLLRFKRQLCHTCLLHGTPSCRNGSGIDLSRFFHADG